MKNKTYILTAAALMLLFASACKKTGTEQPPVQPPVAEKKGLSMNISFTWNGQPMQFFKMQYVKPDGEILMLRTWSMLVAKLSLVRADDSVVMLGDGYQWIDFYSGRSKFNYPTVPPGNYKGIRFQLGPDSAVNHADPNLWPADHPLNANLTGLHWGWAGGYIFQALDGEWQDSMNATTTKGFSFHTAGNQFNKMIFMPFNFSMEGQHKTAQLEFRLEEFFMNPEPIALKVKSSSHSAGAAEEALMHKLLDNGADAFRINDVK